MSYTQKKPVAFEAITVSTTAIGPTAATYSPGNGTTSNQASSNYAFFRCETANVRWRDDGTSPTSSVGHLLNAGETLEYDGRLDKIKFIRTGATDASVTASYFRVG